MSDYGWKFSKRHFLLLYAIFKWIKFKKFHRIHKNLHPMYRAIRNRSNCSFLHEILSYVFWIFWSNFLNWIKVLIILFMWKEYWHGGLSGAAAPLTNEHLNFLNFFKLSINCHEYLFHPPQFSSGMLNEWYSSWN